MSLDIIKSYLVSIGFAIDSNSLQTAEQGIDSAGKTINNFNDNNNKGFQESGEALGDFFTLLGKTSGSVGKLFPNLQTPFKGLIKDILIVKDLYKDLTKETKINPKPTPNTNPQPNNAPTPVPTSGDTDSSPLEPIADGTNAALGVLNKLPTEGVAKLKAFATGAGAAIAAVVAAIAMVVLAIKGLSKFLNDLADQDIAYEKLSRQLWTTKENAKEVSMALETMGATMQDLWLSPTLMKQFTQLRKDSKELKLPKEYGDNLKTVQSIGLEFKRLRQLGTLAFQWIGNYIMKYAAGPLAEVKQALHGFNQWFIKNIPGIAKTIGTIIAVLVRVAMVIGKIIGFLWNVTSPIAAIFRLMDKIPGPVKEFLKVIALIALAILTGPLAALDDFNTAMNGGKSIIGSFFKKIKSGMDSIKGGWDYYYNKAVAVFQKIAKMAKDTWAKIMAPINKAGELWDDAKKNIGDIAVKVQGFAESATDNTVPASYATNNTSSNSTSTANSNNQVANDNKFYIYGSGNPTTTANATSKTLTGLTQRNLQGAY